MISPVDEVEREKVHPAPGIVYYFASLARKAFYVLTDLAVACLRIPGLGEDIPALLSNTDILTLSSMPFSSLMHPISLHQTSVYGQIRPTFRNVLVS